MAFTLLFPTLYTFLLFLLIFLPLIYLFTTKPKPTTHDPTHNLPPGRTGLPLIGETWTFFSMLKKDKAYQFIAERKLKYSDKIFRTSLLGHDMAVMYTNDGNKFLFSNEGKLVRTWWPDSIKKIFSPYKNEPISYEDSKKDRVSIYGPFLRSDRIRRYVATVDSMAKKSVELHWTGREVVKARELVLRHLTEVTFKLFLGVEDPERVARIGKQIESIAVGVTSAPIYLPGTCYWRARRDAYRAAEEIKALIKDKQAIDRDDGQEFEDLVSYLLKYSYEDDAGGKRLTGDEVAVKAMAFLVPATDTTYSTIVSVLNYLAELPSVYSLFRQEQVEIANSKKSGELLNWEDVHKMKYSWNVVREALRLAPPAMGGFKEVMEDFHYEGFYIPKGWKLHCNFFATHRNPEYFPDPDKFDPSRFEGDGPVPYTFLPFGGGPRMCPGHEFARLQVMVFMHNLVINFKWEKVYPTEGLSLLLYSTNVSDTI